MASIPNIVVKEYSFPYYRGAKVKILFQICKCPLHFFCFFQLRKHLTPYPGFTKKGGAVDAPPSP